MGEHDTQPKYRSKFHSDIGPLAMFLSNIRVVIHGILKLTFKPSTMKVGKVWFFLFVAVLVASVVSSRQVSGTGMCYLSYGPATFKYSKTTK